MRSADIATLRPRIGDVVPYFSLSDHTGAAPDLASLTGPDGLMPACSRLARW